MERPPATKLRIGSWSVNPMFGQISRDGESARVELRTMRVLVYLAERAGEVVSIEELLNRVWPDVAVTPDSVYQAVTSLRRVLGDDPKRPAYIETVPRLGYRLVATVEVLADESEPETISSRDSEGESAAVAPAARKPAARLRAKVVWIVGAALCLALVALFLFQGKLANRSGLTAAANAERPQKSIAVLPFLDLTETMNAEPFADGMTEELIDKLSKIPNLRVASPTASSYFKNKKKPLADIAKALGVTCLLDGSVRKSGARLRVAVRLVRADNGYVVWSDTYDRPFDDILKIQDDIAGEVANALRSSFGAPAR